MPRSLGLTRSEIKALLIAVRHERITVNDRGYVLWRTSDSTQNRRCDRMMRLMEAKGLVAPPAQGQSLFTLTEEGKNWEAP